MGLQFEWKQLFFSVMKLLVPFYVWADIVYNRKRAKSVKSLREDAPVLLPIYNYFILFDIVYIFARFIQRFFGLQYYRITVPKKRGDPLMADTVSDAILYMVFGEGIAVFEIIFILSFLVSPSAGKHALWISFGQAMKLSLIFVLVNVVSLSKVHERTAYYSLKLVGTFVVNLYLLSILLYMYTTKSPRWKWSIFCAVWTTLFLWMLYTVVCFLWVFSLPGMWFDICMYIHVIVIDFIKPLLYYLMLIDDSRYWRNLEKYLLPTKSFSMKSNLLENDGLGQIAVRADSGSLSDTIMNFNIPLIDFMEVEAMNSIIGRGGFSVVWKALYRGKPVAIKELKREKISVGMIRQFFREAILCTRFEHENILKFYGVCVAPPEFLMIFEWCNCGCLGEFLLDQFDFLLPMHRICLAIQATTAVAFFHDKGLVHRDLKPQNFLVQQIKTCVTVKLADFGSCRTQYDAMPIFQGISPLFAPPEIREHLPKDLHLRKVISRHIKRKRIMHGPETDVYTFGWVLWAILSEDKWKNILNTKYKRIMEGWLPGMHNFRSELKEIVNRCWTVDPQSRPNIDDIQKSLEALRKDQSGMFFIEHCTSINVRSTM